MSKMSGQVQVIVVIRGGNLVGVYAADFVDVIVVDWDNINDSADKDGQPTEGAFYSSVDPEFQMSEEIAALVKKLRSEQED